LRENKLSLKPEKCEFEKTETKYLGMIIGNRQICMDPTKVQAISEWPNPKKQKGTTTVLRIYEFLSMIHRRI
jgi:hypothetical protein